MNNTTKAINRCAWAGNDPVNIKYHDEQWGVPVFDDRVLFEFLLLEGAQAGLSWITILKRREHYRNAFDNFDPVKIASYTEAKQQKLLLNSNIIRNRLKVAAFITNAQQTLHIIEQCGSFSEFMWQFVGGKPIINQWQSLKDLPVTTIESEKMSKTLKQHGFKFVGPTICYAFMQAMGMVNDHTVDCFRYHELC